MLDHFNIYYITSENQIKAAINNNDMSKYINNKDYKYKKIVKTLLSIAVLTFDGKVRSISSYWSVGIDLERFSNIEDIKIVTKKRTDHKYIAVKQNGKYLPLFIR